MRTLLIALMIALLPLRGWVGDAMAMEMTAATARQSISAIESAADYGHSTRASADIYEENAMPADCPEHAAAHDDQTEAAAHCDSCTACQICHAVALTAFFPQLAPAALPAARPQATALHFASAIPAPRLKPPIS